MGKRTNKLLLALATDFLDKAALALFPLEKIRFEERVRSFFDRAPFHLKYGMIIAIWGLSLVRGVLRGRLKENYLYYLLKRPVSVLIYSAFYSSVEVSRHLGFDEKPPRTPPLAKKNPAIFDASKVHREIKTDVCVIGSGAGGAVVACELAKKGFDVVILEEGGCVDKESFQQLSTLDRNNLIYRDAGLFATLGLPPILLPTGRVVGGTTVINSGTCFRLPDSIFADWKAKFGLDDFSPSLMAPYFDMIERILGVADVPDERLGGNNLRVKKGIEILGMHGLPLKRNAPGCQGSGVCIFGCPTGAKQSMERSFLPMAFSHGARLYVHSPVSRIGVAASRACKVEAKNLTVYPRQVIVCAGTLNTPLLLKRSGIAGNCRALGRHLTIHPTAKMMGLFDDDIMGFHGVPQGYGCDDLHDRGIMFETVFFPPWLMATSIHHSGREHWEIMKEYRRLSVFGFLVHDSPNGRVFAGPGGKAVVFYHLADREFETILLGLRTLGKIYFAAGAKKVFPTIRTIDEISDEAGLERVNSMNIKKRDLEMAAFHPLGTCRMGKDPMFSVVDGRMRVHGYENLWVADGSIFPSSLGVNPQMTIMAFAALCADHVARELT